MSKQVFTILTIDDDPDCRIAACRFITMVGGHKVETAATGEIGIRKAIDLRPDIVLLDMRMPGMDGLDVLDALGADPATREIPVILITGGDLTEPELKRLRNKSNFIGLEDKPAGMQKLLETIEAALLPHGIYRSKAGQSFATDSASAD